MLPPLQIRFSWETMNRHVKRPLTLCLALVFLFLVGIVATETAERLRIAEIRHTLQETTIETREFEKPMPLGKMLGLLTERCSTLGKDLPIWINVHAFDVDADVQEFLKGCQKPAMLDTQIRFPQWPEKMRAATALRLALSQMKPYATYRVCADGVEITPSSSMPEQKSLRVYPVSGLVISQSETWGQWIWRHLVQRPYLVQLP
jgi:hypothetical protein